MEFREMRRKKQELSKEECVKVLEKNTSGVLAVLGDGGYPYTVPLSYVYCDDKIYFHCAKTGHKLDGIKNCNKVSFCVVDQDMIVPEKYTTYFRSVVVFGRAEILEDENEIRNSIEKLSIKYAPNDSKANRDAAIDREYAHMSMVKIEIEHMSGKEAIELIRQKEEKR